MAETTIVGSGPTSASVPGCARKKILIADDIPSNAKLMAKLLSPYDCYIAANGQDALATLTFWTPDVILLAITMPDIDGFEVCYQIKTTARLADIPVVMITAQGDKESKLKGLAAGANDFLTKPIDPAELTIRVANILKIKEYNDFSVRYNGLLNEKLTERTQELESSYQETIERLTMLAEFKKENTGSHIRRIGHYTSHLAGLLGYGQGKLLEQASRMHDIGKVGIPDRILQKKNQLTPSEFEIMKTHTIIGGQILDNPSSPILKLAQIVALYHHEHWDGSGYPYGLRGDNIPIEGLIVAIADRYDALRMARPYKAPFDHDTAMQILTAGDDRTRPEHFFPAALAAFVNSHHTFAQIFATYPD